MPGDETNMTERAYLRDEQYADDSNLAARQAIYEFTTVDNGLFTRPLDEIALSGTESVIDIGCGNGLWLANLAGRGHRGPVIGLDLSLGMTRTAARSQPTALGVADAQDLPVVSDSFDVGLMMHMLYHVPDQPRAVAELRRVVRPGGVALVSTNSRRHLRELDELFVDVARHVTGREVVPPGDRLSFVTENGADVLGTVFDHVRLVRLDGRLTVTEPEPVGRYVASMTSLTAAEQQIPKDRLAAIATQVARQRIGQQGSFDVGTACGVFICT